MARQEGLSAFGKSGEAFVFTWQYSDQMDEATGTFCGSGRRGTLAPYINSLSCGKAKSLRFCSRQNYVAESTQIFLAAASLFLTEKALTRVWTLNMTETASSWSLAGWMGNPSQIGFVAAHSAQN